MTNIEIIQKYMKEYKICYLFDDELILQSLSQVVSKELFDTVEHKELFICIIKTTNLSQYKDNYDYLILIPEAIQDSEVDEELMEQLFLHELGHVVIPEARITHKSGIEPNPLKTIAMEVSADTMVTNKELMIQFLDNAIETNCFNNEILHMRKNVLINGDGENLVKIMHLMVKYKIIFLPDNNSILKTMDITQEKFDSFDDKNIFIYIGNYHDNTVADLAIVIPECIDPTNLNKIQKQSILHELGHLEIEGAANYNFFETDIKTASKIEILADTLVTNKSLYRDYLEGLKPIMKHEGLIKITNERIKALAS